MIKTITFTDINKRNDYINIIKELGFKVSINTYTQTLGSKSAVNDHVLWSWRDVSTVHNTITNYEVNIEKEIGDIEVENKEKEQLNKLEKIFLYKEKEDSFISNLFAGVFIGGILVIFLVNIWDKFWEKLLETGIAYLLWLLVCLYMISFMNKGDKKEKENVEKEINDLKDELIRDYLGEKGKKIIKKL